MGKNSWSNKLKLLKNNSTITDNINILLQGPYFHFKTNFNYDHIICIANGIGITPFITILKQLNIYSTNKKITLLWIIPYEDNIIPFEKYLEELKCNIDIIITRHDSVNQLDERYYKYFNIHTQKPVILNYIKAYLLKNKITNMKDICIYSCGSNSLTKDIVKTTNILNIDLYTENF